MTQPVAYDREGVPLREEDVQGALVAGNAGFRPDAQVWMRDPASNDDRVVSAAEASRLAREGYQYLPGEYVTARKEQASRRREYDGGLANSALAVASGLASGLTFGASDMAIQGGYFGDDAAKANAAIAEFNPGLRTASELGGALVPVLLSGGAGAAGATARTVGAAPVAVSRLGAATERGVLSVLGSGAEQTVARRILSRAAGMGAGGAVEGGLYGAGDAVRQAALTDTELTAEKLLSAAGEGALFGGVLSGGLGVLAGGGREAFNRLAGSRTAREGLESFANRQAARQLLDRREINKVLRYGGESRIDRIGRELLDEGIPLSGKGWMERAGSAVAKKLDDAGRKMEAVAKQMDEAGVRIDTRTMARGIDDKIAAMRSSTSGTERRIAETVQGEWQPLRDMLVKKADDGSTVYLKAGFDDMWKARRKLDEMSINFDKRDPATKALLGLRDSMDTAMDDALRMQPDLVPKWSAAKQKYADYASVRESLTRKGKQEASNAIVSGGDKIAGSAGGILGLLAGMGTGSFGAAALTSAATGAALGAVNKFARDQGAGIMAQASRRLARMDTRLAVSTQRLAGRSAVQALPRTVVPTGSALKSAFDSTRRDLNDARDPQKLSARLAAATGDLARQEPQLAAAIQQRMVGDAQYLQSKLPPPHTTGATGITPNAAKETWSRAQMRDFIKIAAAIETPEVVLDQVADGDIPDPEVLEAVKARRPRLYQSIRDRVIAYASSREEPLPYKQRVALSIAFDFRADESMQPETLSQIQESFVTPMSDDKPGPAAALTPRAPVEAMTLPSERASGV